MIHTILLFIRHPVYVPRRLARDLTSRCYSVLVTSQVLLWFYLCLSTRAPSSHHARAVQEEIRFVGDDGGGEDIKAGPFLDEAGRAGGGGLREDLPPVAAHKIAGQPAAAKVEEVLQESHEEIKRKYYSAKLGHTILPRDPSVVLNGTFVKNPADICSKHEDLDLLIVVHTAPYNFARRSAIRQTVSRQLLYTPYTAQLVFMVGSVNLSRQNPVHESILDNEMNKTGDFVKMDFNEDFRNISLKALMWIRWANEHCHNAKTVLKIDDDVILDLKRILPLSVGYFSKFKRSIFCHLNKLGTQPIPRVGRTKVDPREFHGVAIYPYDYCSGFIVFLSPDMIPLLAKAALTTPFYNVDDLFFTGILPKVIGDVTYHNVGFNVSVWHHKVYNCTVAHGTACPYFGTMAEEPEDVRRMTKAFNTAHLHDFNIPRLRVL